MAWDVISQLGTGNINNVDRAIPTLTHRAKHYIMFTTVQQFLLAVQRRRSRDTSQSLRNDKRETQDRSHEVRSLSDRYMNQSIASTSSEHGPTYLDASRIWWVAVMVKSDLQVTLMRKIKTLPPTTTPPSPTTVAPSPTPTTAVPPSPTADPGPQPSTLPPTPEPPSPTGSSGPPTNTATEMHTATAAPPTTTVCNGSRAYCSDCGIANISVADYKVVNGADASQDEYPYQVIVMPTIKGAEYQCGGSIIKKRWILTAAHCFFDRNGNQPNQNAVVVGYGNINQDLTTQVTATKYIVHENYDKTTSANDIALIELPRALDYETDPAIQPICLAVESDIPYGGKAVATGWGTLVYQGTTLPSILQEVTLDIIPISQCKSLTSLPADTTKVVCALTPTKDTCQGDSGGPLVAKVCPNQWVQIGIVSYGVGCAFPNDPGVYTRVSAFRQWIDVNTGSSTSC
ncbi:trypsin-1-like [Macrobrachium nipponense]|uniref:trypsin-1-like n=1 Tax=Macrobrachium nipponense TaxID=159736 RepID=UPI0030C829C0